MIPETNPNKNIITGVFLGYIVLLLHVLLILGLGFTVVLIKGFYDFRWLFFILGIGLIGGSGYLFYKRLKDSNRSLREAMNDPALRDRTLEISLLGGMASVKLGHKDEHAKQIEVSDRVEIRQLEAPQVSQVQELGELVKMLEKDLLTPDEFSRMKKELIEKSTDC